MLRSKRKLPTPIWKDTDREGDIIRLTREEELLQRRTRQKPMIKSLERYFTKDEAEELADYFEGTPAQTTKWPGYTYDFGRLNKKATEFLRNEIRGKRVIELGDKGYNEDYYFQDVFGAKDYEGCDPKYNVDGLTFLLQQPDESAIVTSFGVLEGGVLYMQGLEIDNLLSRYTAELGRQIYRVTPKGGITIHGLEYDKDLINAGFEPVPINLSEWDIDCVGKMEILRKR